MLFYTLFLICVCIHLVVIRKKLSAFKVVETVLMYYLAIVIGLTALWAFMGHAFVPDQVAKYIGWPTGSPFQYEVAMANLAIGILGVLCIWLKDKFWLATIIAASVFLLGDGVGHIHQLITYNNHSPGNAGMPLYTDFINPIVSVILYIILINLRKKETNT